MPVLAAAMILVLTVEGGREGGRQAVGKDAHERQEETNSAALQWEAGLLARWL